MKGLAFRRLFGVGGSDGGPAGAAGARSAHTARGGAFGPRPSLSRNPGGSAAAAPGGYNRIWRHARQISQRALRSKGVPCIAPWQRRRRKGAMDTSKKWRKPLFRQLGRGPLAPALAAVLRALGPPNAAAPAWPPGLPAPPGPPILPMDAGWGWGRRAPWGTRRGGGVWRPGAARRAAPGLPNKRARPGPLAPGALFQGASRPAAAPPGVGILHRRPGGEGREGSQGVPQALEWRR